NTLGRCYGFLYQKENAINCFEKAIKIQPNAAQPINNLAGFYLDDGEYKKALELYKKALLFDPNNITILANIAKTYSSLNKDKLTLEYCERCLKIDSNNNMVRKTYALALLKTQQYERGWQYFDGRLNSEDFYEKNSFFLKIKKFLSDPQVVNISDKILIIREQGVGDEILYGTMYDDLLSKHQNVTIESDKRLIPLLNNSFNLKNNQQFVPLGSFSKEEEKIKNFDIVLFAGSLGKFFRNSSKSFKKKPYLKILNKDNIKINNLLRGLQNYKKIGISWKSFQKNYGNAKSISLDAFKPIIEKDNLYFINLQYGDVKKELSNFMTNYSLSIKTFKEIDLFQDISCIAALLKNLDLFITVSNSTAHLAGALGVNTLLIKPKNHATFHYWNQPGSKTPWYKNITIIDQNNEKILIKRLNHYINKIKIN
ncbi:tetratricopeptide repeat protein, partial [Alphaproteobacteria bacterium]|nr:tetratricopeptide repeat protein [Alphaproteobacteria bacterium]